jgi:hypothetical protein
MNDRSMRGFGPAIAALLAAAVLALLTVIVLRPSPAPIPVAGPETFNDPSVAEAVRFAPPSTSPQLIRLEQETLAGSDLPLGGQSGGGADTLALMGGDTRAISVEFEVKPAGATFDGTDLQSAEASGQHVVTVAHGLPAGTYQWRARLREGANATDWITFDDAPVHFVVVPPDAPPEDDPDPDVDGIGGVTSGSGGLGEGFRKANASDIDAQSLLWTRLLPIVRALALAGAVSLVVLVGLHWPRRSATHS